MSLEDEAGLANLIIMVDVYQRNQSTVIRSKLILAGGVLQVRDSVYPRKSGMAETAADQARGQLFSLPDSIENSGKSPITHIRRVCTRTQHGLPYDMKEV